MEGEGKIPETPSGSLDIGCGEKKVKGAVGIDRVRTGATDIVGDLESFPWPFKDNCFRILHANNVVEHVRDLIKFMEEVSRVGVSGARVFIETPHFAALSSWEDPTHIRHLSLESFDYFTDGSGHTNHYTKVRFRVVSRKLSFSGSPMGLIGRLIHFITPRNYERRWAFIFRPGTMRIVLEVVK